MAYSATGTAGNDTLNQSSDTGPGTIVGLAGDDFLFTGSGLATVTGESGNDSVVLRVGNTGTVSGGTENDTIADNGTAVGSLQVLGGDGNDSIRVATSTSNQTILGGNDSSDGPDQITSGTGSDLIFGNGGDDQILGNVGDDAVPPNPGNDTMIGGFGADFIAAAGGTNLLFGNEGNDNLFLNANGPSTAFGGLGNDVIFISASLQGGQLFGNEGSDTIDTSAGAGNATIVGGQDSADGADLISAGTGADFIFGNGGADTISAGNGTNTAVGGHGSDTILTGTANDLIFANENNDTVDGDAGNDTAFGGLGNDSVFGGRLTGRDSLQGNEGNDTMWGGDGIDTIVGGAGNDLFRYSGANDDGGNAAGGGPVDWIMDVNWAEDRFTAPSAVGFATNTGAGTGIDLNTSANNAIAAAFALNGGAAVNVAAQFTFAGRTYLAINQNVANNSFDDAQDLLIDITGVTGTIGSSNFV